MSLFDHPGEDAEALAVGRATAKDAVDLAAGADRLAVAGFEVAASGDELSRAYESALYHPYELNYTLPDTESGRRLARR
jgi:hypothetical protein